MPVPWLYLCVVEWCVVTVIFLTKIVIDKSVSEPSPLFHSWSIWFHVYKETIPKYMSCYITFSLFLYWFFTVGQEISTVYLALGTGTACHGTGNRGETETERHGETERERETWNLFQIVKSLCNPKYGLETWIGKPKSWWMETTSLLNDTWAALTLVFIARFNYSA